MKRVSSPHQLLRLGVPETVVALDPATHRMLKFHEPDVCAARAGMLKLDATFYSERDNVQVRMCSVRGMEIAVPGW